MKGLTPGPPTETANATITAGEIITLTAVDFAGLDGYPWDEEDEGRWDVRAYCMYYNGLYRKPGEKTKTFRFSVVA